MSLAGCQIIPIDLNFYLQKCLEIFDKNSADKIQSKNYKGGKLPCLLPIRVKGSFNNYLDRIMPFFDPIVHVVIGWPLNSTQV